MTDLTTARRVRAAPNTSQVGATRPLYLSGTSWALVVDLAKRLNWSYSRTVDRLIAMAPACHGQATDDLARAVVQFDAALALERFDAAAEEA